MSSWTGKSKGTLLGYKILIFILKSLGLSATYFAVRIISFYYYLFAREPKKQITSFYQNQLRYSLAESKKLCRHNFFMLAQSLIDKVALSVGAGSKINYTQEGEEQLIKWAKSGKGGFLLSAHVGNWAVAGNLLNGQNIAVNVLMVENEVEKLQEFLDSQKKTPQFKTIAIKEDMSHLIEIYKALKRGEFICVNADRFLPKNKTYQIDFLGKSAHFPQGIFELIARLKANFAFEFAVKKDKYDYHFTSTQPEVNTDGLYIAKKYAAALEHVVKKHPEQWFNYYDFYANPESSE